MPHWPKPLGKRPIDLGLDRVLKVLERLNNPQNSVPPAIHVAGTNGKGSTIAFIRSILEKSGYSVHVYTSPHLVHFNERIVIAGQQISDKYLHEILEEVRAATQDEKITFFEGTTIGAMLAFARNKGDFCIVETGMGGRLDATNVFPSPIMTIITSISYDHTTYLGDTLEKIAYEKSGIMKPGSICVISRQAEVARKELEAQAIKKRVPVFRCDFEWNVSRKNNNILFEAGGESEFFSLPNLIGDHQIINAGNAIAAVTILRNKFNHEQIDYESINLGLENAEWPSRLEKITDDKNELVQILPKNWELFIDGAHNVDGANILSNWLQDKKAHIILGMTRDKDTKGFLRTIQKNIKSLSAVCVQSEPRSQTVDEVCSSAKMLGIECYPADSIKSAISHIVEIDKDEKSTILICGSLFLTKDVNTYAC